MSDDAPAWSGKLRGRFIVFDGPEGSGKTTQIQRFSQFAESAGVEVCQVREPGGTNIGEQVRNILLDPKNKDKVTLRCEMLLFMASRAQLVDQRIAPAIRNKQLVLADRFICSTLAYQGTAGGLPISDILEVGKVALAGHWPHLIVVFDVDEKTTATRLLGKPRRGNHSGVDQPSLFSDRIEVRGANYHRDVRRGYLEQAEQDPARYMVIDASADADTVFQTLLREIERRIDF